MKHALFIGRFQPFHNAHLKDIRDILKKNSLVIIGIGSSNIKGTKENPFSYSQRKKMIELVLRNNKIKNYGIFPIPDIYDDKKWVDYIHKKLPKFDAVYSGNQWTIKCFKKHHDGVKKIKLIKGISSTIIRDKIKKGMGWKHLVPKEVYSQIKSISKS